MDFVNLKPVQLFCPNCGQKVSGYKGEDGSVRITCKKCRSVIFSKRRTPRETAIKLFSGEN